MIRLGGLERGSPRRRLRLMMVAVILVHRSCPPFLLGCRLSLLECLRFLLVSQVDLEVAREVPVSHLATDRRIKVMEVDRRPILSNHNRSSNNHSDNNRTLRPPRGSVFRSRTRRLSRPTRKRSMHHSRTPMARLYISVRPFSSDLSIRARLRHISVTGGVGWLTGAKRESTWEGSICCHLGSARWSL
jgi:hypothetical protein